MVDRKLKFKKVMEKTMIQTIKCKCGITFAACRVPECYSDADWQKEMRAYVKKGCTVELVEAGSWEMESCTCKKEEKELLLFA